MGVGMRLSDTLEFISLGFKNDRFKTLMSSLGIIIGVMAIVVMLSAGEGLYSGVSSQFSSLPSGSSLAVDAFMSPSRAKFLAQHNPEGLFSSKQSESAGSTPTREAAGTTERKKVRERREGGDTSSRY